MTDPKHDLADYLIQCLQAYKESPACCTSCGNFTAPLDAEGLCEICASTQQSIKESLQLEKEKEQADTTPVLEFDYAMLLFVAATKLAPVPDPEKVQHLWEFLESQLPPCYSHIQQAEDEAQFRIQSYIDKIALI